MSDNGTERWYTVADVAKRFGVTRKTVYIWIDDGKLSVTRLAGRTIRITQTQVDAFLEQSQTKA